MTNRINRFDNYDVMSSTVYPEQIGLINNDLDYYLGTPSLSRNENITFVTSSSRNESILINFKWRPCLDLKSVCLSSRFQLELNSTLYEHKQVVVYEPVASTVRKGRIMCYGSSESCLKFIIAAPYRRFRILFRGLMSSQSNPEDLKFVCCNFTIHPTSGLFDFLKEVGKNSRSRKRHDRHEQCVQIKGEYSIEMGPNEPRVRGALYTWGFYAREIVPEQKERCRNKRIFVHFCNGTVLHLGHFKESKDTNFGYFAEPFDHVLLPLWLPFEVDWENIDSSTKEFEAKIRLNKEKKVIAFKASRAETSRFIYNVETEDNQKGWAWLCVNDAIDSKEEVEKMLLKIDSYSLKLEEGFLAQSNKFCCAEGKEKPLVLRLTESECRCSDLVGSKAASLALLKSFSGSKSLYTVPHAFVLTRFAHESILMHNTNLTNEIAELERYLGYGKLSDLKNKCEKVRKLFEESASLPEVLREKLIFSMKAHYEGDSLDEISFAVRSSSWGEDEEDMSAAGQLSTFLGVQGVEGIIKAVISCFASKFIYTNVEYKRQHGLDLGSPMAIIIQEMVECEKAGVLFTCEPSSGDPRKIIITANYGLGESVVSGQSEPDSILVRASKLPSKELTIERVEVGKKLIVVDKETLRGNMSNQSKYDRSRCCLDNEAIQRLANCGLLVATYFQGPRDIEWGYKGETLFLFQARPITGLERQTEFDIIHEFDQPSRLEKDPSTRANVGEVMPGPLTPLTMSSYLKMWYLFASRLNYMAKVVGNKWFSPEVNEAIFINSSHAFLYLAHKRHVMWNSRDSSGKKLQIVKALELGMFGHEINNEALDEASNYSGRSSMNMFLFMLVFRAFTIRFRLKPIEIILKEKEKLYKIRDNLPELKYSLEQDDNQLHELYKNFTELLESGLVNFKNHGFALIIGNEYNGLLLELLSKYIPDTTELFAALAKFLALPKVIGSEIPECIENISQMIRAKGRIELAEFVKMSPKEALGYIQDDSLLLKTFSSFLNNYGHRGYHEFELATKPWRETPEKVAEMIRKNCEGRQTREVKRKAVTNVQLIESLNLKLSRKDKWLLKNVHAPNCQLFVKAREETKDALILHIDLLRRASKILAEELKRRLRIPDVDLFYYLYFDELQPLLVEPQPGLVFQATRRRQQHMITFKEPWLFDELILDCEFKPHHLKEQKELELNRQKLFGTPASSGRVRSRVCLVTEYSQLDKVREGDILVAHSTDIGFSPVFPLLAGIVTEVGGIISHGAVIAREYGLPSVLGVADVTKILKDGEEIILDADKGEIIRVNRNDDA